MYPLSLTKSREVSRHTVGAYQVVILTDCQSAGFISYAHVAMVVQSNNIPIYAVASETNMMKKGPGEGSHFLCVYDIKHENYGSSDDWADLEKFTQEALRRINQHFTASPEETRKLERLRYAVEENELLLKHFDPETDPYQYATALFNVGSAYHELARKVTDKVEPLARARDAFQKGLKHLKAENDLDEYISAFVQLAEIYFDLAGAQNTPVAWIKARDIHQEVISDFAAHKITTQDFILGDTYDRLGDIFKRLGGQTAALTAWNSAKQAYQRSNITRMVQLVTNKIDSVILDAPKPSTTNLPPAPSVKPSAQPSQPPSPSLFRRTIGPKPHSPNNPAGSKNPVRVEPAKPSSAISQEFLRVLMNNTVVVKTLDPKNLTDWQSDLIKFQQQMADTKIERAFIDSLLAVTHGHAASLPADNPFQTRLAQIIGTIAGFHLPPKEKTASGQPSTDQDTFTRLFLEASDLPTSLKPREDHRRGQLQPRDIPFEECGGLHSGLMVWTGEITDPIGRLVDIRLSFPSKEAAYAYHHQALIINCEGLKGAIDCQPVGTDGFVFGGKSKDPIFGMEMTQFIYLFHVQRTVVKLYVAEGDRLAPGQALTAQMIEPIAEKIVSRILSVGG